MKINKRNLMGTPTAELSQTIKIIAEMIQETPSQTAKEQLSANLTAFAAELERRTEMGGEVLSDVRAPHMTDGERLAAGLEPANDSM